jgi:hypothetical protein
MEGQHANYSHGQDLVTSTNIFRDKFHFVLLLLLLLFFFFLVKVSYTFFKIIGDDTECTRRGGLQRESHPKCVRGAEESCGVEG